MARSAKSAPLRADEPAHAGGVSGDEQAANGSFPTAQMCLSRSLMAAQTAAGWLEDLQREVMMAATTWVETLAMGAREAERAADIDELLAVPAHMFNRQLDISFRRLGEGMQRMLEGEVSWLDELREQAQAVARGAAGTPSLTGGNGPAPLLEPWGLAFGQWQAAAQQWTSSVISGTAH